MQRWKRSVWLCLAVAWAATPVWADALADLETFLQRTQQGRASFVQTVWPVARSGQTVRPKTSQGEFEFARPQRFRFHYTQPFEQWIVADGQTLWWYDVDLQQVTVRRQAEALGNTPAGLVTSATDLKALARTFELANAPDADGQQWVSAQPRQRDGPWQSLRMGFRRGQLSSLEMLDSFGQRSLIQFGAFEQSGFKPGHFSFQPPAGVDVLRP